MNAANINLIPSPTCLALTERSEGFRSTAYWDVTGWAIGFGHHGADVEEGSSWTLSQAQIACEDDLNNCGDQVRRMVSVILTQGQFDALCDFTYNLGAGRLENSTLLRLLNAGDYAGAGEQLLAWNHVGGEENPGLKARREAELALWNS